MKCVDLRVAQAPGLCESLEISQLCMNSGFSYERPNIFLMSRSLPVPTTGSTMKVFGARTTGPELVETEISENVGLSTCQRTTETERRQRCHAAGALTYWKMRQRNH